ncbi:hypothetical protein NYR60_06010 [Actinobacillus genomosp. 2]|uniref:hypothetical protein n=1 Tax=Actinobacillus genomosp. 2 TaxID=230709 RepID=UPI002441AA07|nr:hypothetical protein [Actinobacillus genomosp. 2]WGE31426.1 hypothetical protein NYR60_06010 [Actinobacillus genomosp. 2]
MKLIKSLTALAFASLVTLNTQAAEVKTSAEKPTQQAVVKDKNLEKFNRQVELTFTERGIGQQDNKAVAVFKYVVRNKGKTHIKSITWHSVYAVGDQGFFAQDIPVVFDKTLGSKAKTDVTISIPLESLPENVRQILSDPKASVRSLNVAKELVFANGAKIVVK